MCSLSPILSDIQDFVESKKIIRSIYYDRNYELLQYEENADVYWLVSDLLLFIKRNRLEEIYERKSKKYNYFLSKNDSIFILFHSFWGFLSVEERNRFISLRKSRD